MKTLLLFAVAIASAAEAHGQSFCTSDVFPPNPQSASYAFGFCAVRSGDTLAVSDVRDNPSGPDSGSVHVYVLQNGQWLHQAWLLPSAMHPYSDFGAQLDLDGDRLVVGSHGEDSFAGAVYVYERTGSTWAETARLQLPGVPSHQAFGYSVSLHGDRLVAGAKWRESAFVYELILGTWVRTAELVASDAAFGSFGSSIDLDGDAVVVGAYHDNTTVYQGGSAYVFERSGAGWQQVAKLVAPDVTSGLEFSNSVAISGDSLVVGAQFSDQPWLGTGAAYVYVRSSGTWSFQQRLAPAELQIGDRFGVVDISGQVVVVGGADTDAVYVFDRLGTAWSERGKIVNTRTPTNDRFGNYVSIEQSQLVVGAIGRDPMAAVAGAAYTYDLGSEPCSVNCGGTSTFDWCEIALDPTLDLNANGVLDACECLATNYCIAAVNSTGQGARIAIAGTPSISLNSMTLICTQLPPNSSGRFFYGPNQIQVPFGNGYRCVGGPTARMPVSFAGSTGTAARSLDLQHPAPGAPTLLPGSTWNFQYWYRNVLAGGAGFNLSDGLSVRFCP